MSINDLFWNQTERRPRALWRLVLQVLLFLACAFGSGAVLVGSALLLGLRVGGNAGAEANLAVLPGLIALAGTATSMIVAGRFLDRRPFADFGFHIDRRWWADLGFGLALGVVLMGGIFLVGRALGWIHVTATMLSPGPATPALPALGGPLAAFICVGIWEEMTSRGYHLLNVAEGLDGPLSPQAALAMSCVVSSAVFGVLHVGNPNATLLSTVCLVGAGLLFGLAYVVTGELALPIGLHTSWNFAQGNLFGFPVSGTDAGASLLSTEATGPPWWTGGAFGPEAGASGLLALVVAAVLILAWTRACRGSAAARLRLGARDDATSPEAR